MSEIIGFEPDGYAVVDLSVFEQLVDLMGGITFDVPDANTIIVKGVDKQLVGQTAAVIRGKRPPEPYHGKGVKYADEHIRRKAGKTSKGK